MQKVQTLFTEKIPQAITEIKGQLTETISEVINEIIRHMVPNKEIKKVSKTRKNMGRLVNDDEDIFSNS